MILIRNPLLTCISTKEKLLTCDLNEETDSEPFLLSGRLFQRVKGLKLKTGGLA
jgi:hypothetical protein